MAASRQKGCRAELDIARKFEIWWRRIEPTTRFCRTPLSGGWGDKQLQSEFRTSGDLMTTAKDFPFAIEVKHRENWSYDHFIACKASPVWEWWNQAKEQATTASSAGERIHALLVFKKNRMSWKCGFSSNILERDESYQEGEQYSIVERLGLSVDYVVNPREQSDIMLVCELEDFLKVEPAKLQVYLQERK